MVLLKCIFRVIKYNFKTLSTFHYGSIKISGVVSFLETFSSSTFHYGSIKIKENATKPMHIYIPSTFHYGSIKIIIKYYYLLKFNLIYIPLWFY